MKKNNGWLMFFLVVFYFIVYFNDVNFDDKEVILGLALLLEKVVLMFINLGLSVFAFSVVDVKGFIFKYDRRVVYTFFVIFPAVYLYFELLGFYFIAIAISLQFYLEYKLN